MGSFVIMFLNTEGGEMNECPDISSRKIKTCRLATIIITWGDLHEYLFEAQREVTFSLDLLIKQDSSKI